MDPNMNNMNMNQNLNQDINQNNQMGMQQPQMMNQQEQAQAQVLNYNDVNYVAETEAKSSSLKKVAIFLALIAIILIGGGVVYKFIPSDEETPTSPSTTKAITPTNGTGTCTMADNQGTSKLIMKTVYNMNYDDNLLLTGYTKDYTATTIPDDIQSQATFTEKQAEFQKLVAAVQTTPINGYTITLTEPAATDSPKTLNVRVIVDFTLFDNTQLTTELMANAVTNVDLKKGDSKNSIEQSLRSYGYTCQ